MTIQTLLDLLGKDSSPQYQKEQVLQFVRDLLGTPHFVVTTTWQSHPFTDYYLVTVPNAHIILGLGPNEEIHKT